jgi:hypothetical protein
MDPMTVDRAVKAIAALMLVTLIVAGCRTASGAAAIQSVTVSELARDLKRGSASLRGKRLRVCKGRLQEYQSGETEGWPLGAIGETYRHGARVFVKTCGAVRPSADADGCFVGHVARSDGSLNDPAPDEPVLSSAVIESYTWYLHQPCPSSGGSR